MQSVTFLLPLPVYVNALDVLWNERPNLGTGFVDRRGCDMHACLARADSGWGSDAVLSTCVTPLLDRQQVSPQDQEE